MKFEFYHGLPTQARKIREDVFVKEQGFLEEFDSDDTRAVHILAFDGSQAIATCRFFRQENYYLIVRIAVLKDYRGKGVGKEMLEHAENRIVQLGGKEIRIHAQQSAEEFYKKLDFISMNVYDYEQDCRHVWMRKSLF